MHDRLAAALFITLAAADVARADVPSVPSVGTSGMILTIGTVMAGLALTAGIVIAGVVWVRRKNRPGDINAKSENSGDAVGGDRSGTREDGA